MGVMVNSFSSSCLIYQNEVMGKRRKRIGRIHKNFEKKRQALKINKPGRPRKYTAPSLNDLKGCAVLPSTAWTVSMSEDTLKFHKCKDQPNPQQPVMVTHCLVIKNDLSWHVSVHGSIVSSSSSPLSSVSEHLTRKSLNSLITTLDTATVCAGHPDKHLLEYARSKKGKLLSKTGEVIARVDDTAAVCLNGKAYLETIRSTSCALLVHGSKCSSCTAYRDTLRSSYNQWKKKNKSASERALSISHTNARFLNSPEKKKKISEWKARARAAEMKVHRLVEKLMVSTKKHGIELNEDLHNDLTQIMRDKTNDVQKKYEKKCFQRVFWEQQLQALKAKSPKQYRWHPMMIRWCLHLHMLSSATYRAMQSSGVITLPSQRTLRDYSRWIKSEVGIQPAVTSQLVQEATAKSMNSDLRQYVAVVFDEMKVKEGIVYDKHNLQVVGFVNLGDANNQLVAFQQQLETGDGTPQVAKHMLVFMVRGIFYKLDFPYAQFATRAITADFLYPLLWDVIRHLECAAFKVISVTGDKASANRKLFRMHHSMDSSRNAVTYKVKNPYSEEERYVYFFSDVPHLIKTVRNCWSNSFGHNHKRALWVSVFLYETQSMYSDMPEDSLLLYSQSRYCNIVVAIHMHTNIQINGQHISWEHIRRVYNRSQCASGLSLLPKLTREHVELNSYSRMRVNLAAQVKYMLF